MHINRLFLDYATPGLPTRRRYRREGPIDGLVCLVKLVCCFAVASVVGSVVAVLVAVAIDRLMN